jgi:hypothetical protein
MVQWPWVGRLAFDLSRREVEYLRGQNQVLQDALIRLQRKQSGLSELPREARPAVEPMPDELKAYIEGFAGKGIRKQMRDTAFRRHAGGESWNSIVRDVLHDATPTEGADNG